MAFKTIAAHSLVTMAALATTPGSVAIADENDSRPAHPASPAHPEGRDAETPPPLFGPGPDFRVAGYAWFPRFDGDVRLGPNWLGLRDDLGHGSTRTAPWGEFDLRCDIWDLRLGGYTVSEDASGTASRGFGFGSAVAAAGDRVHSDLRVDSVGAEVGVALWRPFAEKRLPWSAPREMSDDARIDAGRADLRFGLVGSARWIGLDHDVEIFDGADLLLGRDGVDTDWFSLGGGATVEFAVRTKHLIGFVDHIVVRGVGGAAGIVAGGSGSMWEVRAGIDLMFTPNFGLSLGYRLQEFDFRDGDYGLDGGLQGLVVGGAIRF